MGAKDIETLVRELLDREAIRDLPLQYCHYVWKNDVEGIVQLFTEEGAMTASDPSLPQAQGREGLRKMYEQALGDLMPRPFIHNHVIELNGPDRAVGTCYVELRGTRDGQTWIAAGYYDDEYTKVRGEWKFQSRRITLSSSSVS